MCNEIIEVDSCVICGATHLYSHPSLCNECVRNKEAQIAWAKKRIGEILNTVGGLELDAVRQILAEAIDYYE